MSVGVRDAGSPECSVSAAALFLAPATAADSEEESQLVKPNTIAAATAQPAREILVDVPMTSVRSPSDPSLARQYRVSPGQRTRHVRIS